MEKGSWLPVGDEEDGAFMPSDRYPSVSHSKGYNGVSSEGGALHCPQCSILLKYSSGWLPAWDVEGAFSPGGPPAEANCRHAGSGRVRFLESWKRESPSNTTWLGWRVPPELMGT